MTITAGGGSSAQTQPMIPEVACTRLTLVPVPVAGSRAVGLRVVNDDPSDFSARVRPEVEVEREVNGRWERVGVAGFQLRARCDRDVRECVTLAPRSAITVVPWTGMLGDGQCVCTRCAPAPAGRYRFVVNTCQDCFNPRRSESPAFTLASP